MVKYYGMYLVFLVMIACHVLITLMRIYEKRIMKGYMNSAEVNNLFLNKFDVELLHVALNFPGAGTTPNSQHIKNP